MKKRFGLLGLFLIGLLALASCRSVDSVIKKFNPQLTTLSATYDVDYDMLVDSNNESMKGYEKQLDDTSIIEADYTEGNLYLYGKRTEADGKIFEVLLINDGGYKYVTSRMKEFETVDSETKALEKMDELLKTLTYREAGWISTKSFTYSEKYAHNQFLHDSENVQFDMVEKPTL